MFMKAIALFSGGLDSTLAAKVILEQGIDVVTLHCLTPFCTCDKKGCGVDTRDMAKQLGIELKGAFLGEEYLSIVKNPKYGYGKNFNPCIDCRILILRKAKEVMKEYGASFIITGEVLGQRPKSQHKDALNIIEQESGLAGLIVRPLSAKLLAPTIPEKEGWVKRDRLLDICGRTRKPQIRLAHLFGIKNYPCAAGGCLLTDPAFCKRLKDLFDYGEFNLREIELLKIGRHFRLNPSFKLIVGRDEKENKKLIQLVQRNDVIFRAKELAGPTGIGKGIVDEHSKILSAQIIARYAHPNGAVKISVKVAHEEQEVVCVERKDQKELERLRI
ncbi:MAG: hypothetical protein JSW40_03225 [Candidatus Omnitrophota bacterium]|nr:MAG: hypothetical protein JSW40_03225 [Candidatus Omnitrophota bacterium]